MAERSTVHAELKAHMAQRHQQAADKLNNSTSLPLSLTKPHQSLKRQYPCQWSGGDKAAGTAANCANQPKRGTFGPIVTLTPHNHDVKGCIIEQINSANK